MKTLFRFNCFFKCCFIQITTFRIWIWWWWLFLQYVFCSFCFYKIKKTKVNISLMFPLMSSCGIHLNSWWEKHLQMKKTRELKPNEIQSGCATSPQNGVKRNRNWIETVSDVYNYYPHLFVQVSNVCKLVCGHHFKLCDSNSSNSWQRTHARENDISKDRNLLVELCTYNADWLSHGVSGQIFAESCAYTASAAVQSGDFAPNSAYSWFDVRFLWQRFACLCFEHIHASFAHIEITMLLLAATINLRRGGTQRVRKITLVCCCWATLLFGNGH